MPDDADFAKRARRVLFGKSNPEIPGAGKSAAERAKRHIRTKVTMNLDGDVVEYFKELAQSEGRSYQLLINQVLREYIEGTNPEKLARTVGELLLESPSFIETLAERLKGGR